MNETYRTLLRPPATYDQLTELTRATLSDCAGLPDEDRTPSVAVLGWLDGILDCADRLSPLVLRAWCLDAAAQVSAFYESGWVADLDDWPGSDVDRAVGRAEAILNLLTDDPPEALMRDVAKELSLLGFDVDGEISAEEILETEDLYDAACVCALLDRFLHGPHHEEAEEIAHRTIERAAVLQPDVWSLAAARIESLRHPTTDATQTSPATPEPVGADVVGLLLSEADKFLTADGFPVARRRYVDRSQREVVPLRFSRWTVVHVHELNLPGADQSSNARRLIVMIEKVS